MSANSHRDEVEVTNRQYLSRLMIIRENKIIDQFSSPKLQQIWLPFWKLLEKIVP